MHSWIIVVVYCIIFFPEKKIKFILSGSTILKYAVNVIETVGWWLLSPHHRVR